MKIKKHFFIFIAIVCFIFYFFSIVIKRLPF